MFNMAIQGGTPIRTQLQLEAKRMEVDTPTQSLKRIMVDKKKVASKDTKAGNSDKTREAITSPKYVLEVELDMNPKFWMDFETIEGLGAKSSIEGLFNEEMVEDMVT